MVLVVVCGGGGAAGGNCGGVWSAMASLEKALSTAFEASVAAASGIALVTLAMA